MFTDVLDTVILSLTIASMTTLLVMLFSIFFCYWLVTSSSYIASIIGALFYIPMVLPPVAVGYGLLLWLGPASFFGQILKSYFDLEIAFNKNGALIAAFMASVGLGIKTMRLAYERIDQHQLDIAFVLGAKKSQIFRHIILPQCYPAIMGGGILVFMRALSEFGATMVLAGTSIEGSKTLAVAIWLAIETPGKDSECLILVLVACAISLFALLGTEILAKKLKEFS